MASTNKCLAQSNKSLRRGQATKKRGNSARSAAQFCALAQLAIGSALPAIGVIVRIKFEATDTSGKVHKRSSTSHVYSHCLLIHFAAHPPTRLWPDGIAAYSHAEWAETRVLAERKATRWHKEPDVEAVEILDARQV
jgi:hypothetical protein